MAKFGRKRFSRSEVITAEPARVILTPRDTPAAKSPEIVRLNVYLCLNLKIFEGGVGC